MSRVMFWLPLSLLAWVYVGYPIAAGLKARFRPYRIDARMGPPGRVTVGIAVHDEAHHLLERIENVLAQVVPFELEVIVASDGSSDSTVDLARALAQGDQRVRVLDLPRQGQTSAQNAIFAHATGDVVVLSDAQTRFVDGCLRALVAPFRDPSVGCTTGQIVWSNAQASGTSQAEGAYWRYEQAVRRAESGAGWLTAVTGAVLAFRRTRFHPVPPYASMDHLLPLYAREAGDIVLAVPEARAIDEGIERPEAQFRNRSRTATRGIQANLAMAARLAPWRRPAAALAIWSHKLLRWATPWLAGSATVASLVLATGGAPAYGVFAAGSGAGLALGVIGLARGGRGERDERGRLPRILSVARSILLVNLAFLVGWIHLLRRKRIESWHRTDWDPVDITGASS